MKRRLLLALGLLPSLGFCASGADIIVASDDAYRASVEKWRRAYEDDLKSDTGWLSIAGLFWLHEGENRFGSDPLNDIVLPEGSAPPDVGYIELRGDKVTAHVDPGVVVTLAGKPVTTAEMTPDSQRGHTKPSDTQLVIGHLQLWVHASGGRLAIRLRDKNSLVRKNFTGLHWFPVDESYRVTARYRPYEKDKKIDIQNLAGDSLSVPVSGFVTFVLRGQELRLDAQQDDEGKLTFVFRDFTSGKETYGAARFLDTVAVKNGEVILDFNEAYNPPCAYNPYTTCPLPPPQNRLRARIEAGEMNYRHDH